MISQSLLRRVIVPMSLCLMGPVRVRAGDLAPLAADHAERMKAGLELFKEHVRADLTTHCLECHGGKSTKADFDISSREALLDSGFVGERADESQLYFLITHQEEPHMPFGKDKLDEGTIQRIAKWIDLGAPYDRPLVEGADQRDESTAEISEEDRDFWSFLPLANVELPEVGDSTWARNPIDHFIQAKQTEAGVRPSGPLPTRQLVRRAYFDLIGLPPSPEEMEAALNTVSRSGFEALSDQLLENPHYGERWGRHWLDVARFAESHGFEQDYDRSFAYHYRDFVIRALNEDIPFDQFVRWQVAGDELAPDDPQALLATGFLGGGVFPTQITAREVERVRYDALDDMASTTCLAVLGMTVGCARCHDHKYDPIPSQDYYRLLSVFTTTVRGDVELELGDEGDAEARERFERDLADREEALKTYQREVLPGKLAAFLSSPHLEPDGRDPWTTVAIDGWHSSVAGGFKVLEDGSVLAENLSRGMAHLIFEGNAPSGNVASLRIELLPPDGPASDGPGGVAISEIQVLAGPADGSRPLREIRVNRAHSTTNDGDIAKTIDGDTNTHWSNDAGVKAPQGIVLEFGERVGETDSTRFVVVLHAQSYAAARVRRARFSVSAEPTPVPIFGSAADEARTTIREALNAAQGNPTEEQSETIRAAFAKLDPEYVQLQAAVDDLKRAASLPAKRKAMICSEGITPMRHHTQGADFFEQTYFLKRGDVDQKNGEAPPGFLHVLCRAPDGEGHWQVAMPEGSKTSGRRSALAYWLTDVDYGAGHLAARVIVNRLWHHHFGRGIVATPSDFGFMGERPTHPELLDWLATELIRNGWRLKPIHRLIMTSATYQQGVTPSEENRQADADNHLWWKVEPRRMEAEIIRDNLLATSGLLSPQMFGPGTLYPGHHRRAIYFSIKRSRLISFLQLFDWPDSLGSMGARPITTTASQALVFLNDRYMKDYAEQFAKRVIKATGDDVTSQVRRAYEIALARPPREDELRQGIEYQNSARAAAEPNATDDAARQALAEYCQVLMSLNEFSYIP
jgi:cytochrome c553